MARQQAEGRRMNQAQPLPVRTPSSFILDPSSLRRRGFSFTEVLFAVIILGIGFIMVAAIFPVAIQQAKNTSEEVTASTVARSAVQSLGGVFRDGQTVFSPTAGVGSSNTANSSNCNLPVSQNGNFPAIVQQPGHDYPVVAGGAAPLWKSIAGNLVIADDPRFAWTMLFRRDGDQANVSTWANSAQVYIFCLQSRNKTEFDPVKDSIVYTISGNTYPANLQAKPLRVAILNDVAPTGVDLIAFDLRNSLDAFNAGAAVEGGYVIIAQDNLSGLNTGRMNGRIYRLGSRRVDLDRDPSLFPSMGNQRAIYELDPANEFTPDAGADGRLGTGDDIVSLGVSGPTANAFVIGRGYHYDENTGLPDGFEGTSMAIGVYTSFVGVKKN